MTARPNQPLVVAAVERLAAAAGARIAAAGGNVVDAALAAAFAQGVVNPVRAGIGGGGVIMVHSATGAVTVLDCIGVAPLGARPDMFEPDGRFGTVHRAKGGANRYGYLASIVPGLVRGADVAFHRFGSGAVSWRQIVEPAVELAADGFPIFPHMAESWDDIGVADGLGSLRDSVLWSAESRRVLRRPDDTAYRIGEILRQPDYADTLRRIAEHGADEFYLGATAARIVADFDGHGGLIGARDLAEYQPVEDTPISGRYRDLTLRTQGPPSVGPTLLEILSILSGWDFTAASPTDPDYLTRLIESIRVAFTDRTESIGDPRYTDVPLDRLLGAEYARTVRARIDADLAAGRVPGPVTGPAVGGSGDTTHVTAVDAAGNAALITHSIGRGSGVVTGGLGFMHNSHMNMFDPRPGTGNSVARGKRPNSGGAPVIGTREGQLVLAMGSPAGGRKATSMAQALMNHFEFGLPLGAAVDAPRVHLEDDPGHLEVDYHFDPAATVELGGRGYPIVMYRHHARLVAVVRDPGTGSLTAASDFRGDRGVALARG